MWDQGCLAGMSITVSEGLYSIKTSEYSAIQSIPVYKAVHNHYVQIGFLMPDIVLFSKGQLRVRKRQVKRLLCLSNNSRSMTFRVA